MSKIILDFFQEKSDNSVMDEAGARPGSEKRGGPGLQGQENKMTKTQAVKQGFEAAQKAGRVDGYKELVVAVRADRQARAEGRMDSAVEFAALTAARQALADLPLKVQEKMETVALACFEMQAAS